ncbi:MAG TPA: ribonuclease HII [Acidimicrobiales bacterium]|nr:ribonuclease HII [Acidimicrobiales bacterium]
MPAADRDAGVEVERQLVAAGCRTVAGIDEVGRGAWAGPLTVCVAVVSRDSLETFPAGVRDSKLLSPRQREGLLAPVLRHLCCHAIGHASAVECDDLGMAAALRLAARRALEGLDVSPDGIIVDGPRNFTGRSGAVSVVRADRLCAVVAAASILAKVTRDRLMTAAAEIHPGYGFERNKGYASIEHRLAVARLGTTPIHRLTWSVKPVDPFTERDRSRV